MMLALIALAVIVLLFSLSLCHVASQADAHTEKAFREYLAQQQKDTAHPER